MNFKGNTSKPPTGISLEVRPNRMGYAVFSGTVRLFDWGLRWFAGRGTLESLVTSRTRDLILAHQPEFLLVRNRTHWSTKDKRFESIVSSIRAEAKRHGVLFRVLSEEKVHGHFAMLGHTNKYQIADTIARRFEELSWKLPHPKKRYENEVPRVAIFDAVATGLAFLEHVES
jgi:hypothetical protein